MTLGEGGGDQAPPSHTLSWLLIANILQEACPRDWITKTVVLAPGEAILFFGRCLYTEGLPYRSTRDVECSLRGPVNWARRTVEVEVTTNTVQVGCQAIVDAVMKNRMKVRGPGYP